MKGETEAEHVTFPDAGVFPPNVPKEDMVQLDSTVYQTLTDIASPFQRTSLQWIWSFLSPEVGSSLCIGPAFKLGPGATQVW